MPFLQLVFLIVLTGIAINVISFLGYEALSNRMIDFFQKKNNYWIVSLTIALKWPVYLFFLVRVFFFSLYKLNYNHFFHQESYIFFHFLSVTWIFARLFYIFEYKSKGYEKNFQRFGRDTFSFIYWVTRISFFYLLIFYGFYSFRNHIHITNYYIVERSIPFFKILLILVSAIFSIYLFYLLQQEILFVVVQKKKKYLQILVRSSWWSIVFLIVSNFFWLIFIQIFSKEWLYWEPWSFFFITFLIWFYIGSKYIEKFFIYNRELHTKQTKNITNTFGKIFRSLLLMIGFVKIATIYKVNLGSLINLIGGGSFMIAVGGKEIIANYLSGFILYFENPFDIGDWIYSPDNSVEGTVEEIRIRCTVIRTFDKRLLQIPNSFFSVTSIINASRMSHRRIKTDIAIKKTSGDLMEQLTKKVRIMLRNHPELDKEQRLMVHFFSISESALNLNIYVFTKTKDWALFRQVRENILLRIIRIIHEVGAEMAYPVRFIQKEKKRKKEEPVEEIKNLSSKII